EDAIVRQLRASRRQILLSSTTFGGGSLGVGCFRLGSHRRTGEFGFDDDLDFIAHTHLRARRWNAVTDAELGTLQYASGGEADASVRVHGMAARTAVELRIQHHRPRDAMHGQL